MSHIHKTVKVNAPVADVFAYLTDPEHLLEIWPSMVEVSNVERTAEGEQHFDWTYKMAGIRFKGHADSTEVQKNRHVVVQNKAGISSTFDWKYDARDGGTEVTLDVDYEIPGKVLSVLGDPIVSRINDREAETMLANLKTRFEEGKATRH